MRGRGVSTLVAVAEPPPFEQTSEARLDRREHIGDVRRGQRWGGMEPHAHTILREHAVDHECVCVHVEIHRPAKTLHAGHRAAAAVDDAGLAGDMAQEAEDRAHVHPHHRAAQVVIPGQHVAQARRQAQDPLPHGHRREHVVHQVRGALRHAAPATARTKAAPLAGKRHQPIESASVTAKARKPAGEIAAPQKIPELLFDESWQALAVSERRRLGAERLDVFEHDLMEHALRRTSRLVTCRRLRHSTAVGGPHATRRATESGLNRWTGRSQVAIPAPRYPAAHRGSCGSRS